MAYKFNFSRVGDITRVNIATADDIRHLGELDKKMWTVLSCPVKGLEIDEQSLKYMDTNNDGAIHVDEVVAVSQWLSNVLKDMAPVMEGKDALALSNLSTENEEGAKLKEAAEKILKEVGKESETIISLADSSSSLATFLKNKLEAAQAAINEENAVAAPYGDQTDAIDAAYRALDAKVKDFFMRAKLSSFSKESTAVLDVQVSSIEAIATDNLTDKMGINGEFDLMILDPPAFAKHYNVLNNALKGYRRLNTKALEMIRPGGILFTFSCSQAIDKQTFRMCVMEASLQAKRNIRILHQLTQPNDHPISIYHPEGEYLKGLVVFVE